MATPLDIRLPIPPEQYDAEDQRQSRRSLTLMTQQMGRSVVGVSTAGSTGSSVTTSTALSLSTNVSVADSKAVSSSVNCSVADSKATSDGLHASKLDSRLTSAGF